MLYERQHIFTILAQGYISCLPCQQIVHRNFNCFIISQNILSYNVDDIMEIISGYSKCDFDLLLRYIWQVVGAKQHKILGEMNAELEINKYLAKVMPFYLSDQSPLANTKLLTDYYFSRQQAECLFKGIILYWLPLTRFREKNNNLH